MKKYFSRKKLLFIGFIFLLCISLVLYIKNISATDSQDRIHFIRNEETSGDAIVIESNGHCGLIDTMNPNTSSSVAPDNNFVSDNGTKVYNYIKNKVGCNYLDFLILTHNHSDHIGGVPELGSLVNSKTIVFYKYDRTVSDDVEEAKGWHNQDYYNVAINYINKKTSKKCDVSVSNKQPTGGCYLANLSNTFISKVEEDPNPFTTYNTKVDYTYYFDFGDYRINMYNLYNNSYHKENLNSIVTLVTHKNSGAKIALTGDIETGIGDGEYEELAGKSNLKITPAGTCSRCKNYGLENQVADVIGKVDILKAGHHGAATSNSLYTIKKYQPSYYISTRELPMKNNMVNHSANKAAVLYAYKNYGTISHYTNQASTSDGAIIFQINDSTSNKITLLNSNLTNVATIQPDGWARINNGNYNDKAWGYVTNSSLSTGWKDLNGHWYYFDSTGIMKEGLVEVGDEIFYLTILPESSDEQPEGSMITGWKKVNSDWYYFNPISNGHRGAAVTGWFNDTDGHWYYLRQSKNEIYNGPKGTMITGLRTVNGKVYYFRQYKNDVTDGPTGSMLTNACTTINNKEYCFDNSGYLIDKTLNSIKDISLSQGSVLCEQNRVTSGSNKVLQMQGVYFFEKNNVPYAIYSGWTDDDSSTILTLVNLSTCSVVDRNSSMVMGHANDITFNPGNSTYYVTGGDNHKIYSFKISNSNKITNVALATTIPDNYYISSLTYNSDAGKWYSYHSKKLYSFDNFGDYIYREKIADTPTYYTNFKTSWFVPQGIAYSNNNLYFARTISDTNSAYYNHTYVMVYNATTGKYKYTLHLTNNSSTGYDGHIEGLSVVGNKLYLGYNVNHTSTKKQAYVVYEGIRDIDDEYELSMRTKLTVPTLSQTEYTYSGNEINPVINGFDSNTMTISGINSATDVGEYVFTIGLKNTENYVWSDNSFDDIEFTWTIDKATLPKPIVENYVGTYDGEDHGVSITNLGNHEVLYSLDNENFSDEVITRSEAGVTTLYVKFKGDENNLESESTEATITVNKADLTNVSVMTFAVTYDGEKHYPIIPDHDFATIYYSTDGDNWTTEPPYRIDSGETLVYAKYVGDENHNDYDLGDVSIVINKADSQLSTTLLNSNIMKDTDETLLKVTPSVDGVLNITSSDTSVVSITNNPIIVNAGEEYNIVVSGVSDGNATVTFELVPVDSNYNTATYEQEVNVIEPPKTVVDIPTTVDFCKKGLIYNGTNQTITNNPLTGYTFSNNVQTDAGTYTVVASLQDGYIWSNDTITNKEFYCSVGKADVEINTNTITDYQGIYDGIGHSITADSVSGTTTMYSLDQENWSEYNPSKIDVGSTTVYVKYFGDNNHGNSEIYSGTITINKADLVVPNNNITNYSGKYDGIAHSISVTPIADATIVYSQDGETFTEEKDVFTDVGEYTLYVKYLGDSNHNDSSIYEGTVSINKGDLNIPSNAVQNYNGIYDGESHTALVSEVENALPMYSTDGENWSFINPSYTSVGVYTTYVKYVGDSNHNDSNVYDATITINKADLEVPSNNITNYSGSYDGSSHSITSGDVLNAITVYSEDGDNWTSTKPSYTNVGEYTTYIKYLGDNNHNDSAVYEGTVEITKANLVIPNNNITSYEGTYDASAHSISVGNVSGADIYYSLDQSSWSTINPTRTNVGEETIYVKYVGDNNHNDSEVYSGTITINKADLVIPDVYVTNYHNTYDGDAHSITVTPLSGTTISYSLDGTNWTSENPTRTNAGETVVYFKYVGDANHNDSETKAGIINIEKANLVLPENPVPDVNVVYDGSEHSIVAADIDGATTNYSLDQDGWSTDNPTFINAGDYMIFVMYVGDENHNDEYMQPAYLTINKASLNIPSNNIVSYSGEYDGNPHSISVLDVPYATIKYSETGKEWSTDNITYTDAGNHTVYVKYFGDSNHSNSTVYEGTVTITKSVVTIPNDNITNYSGVYDGQPHSITVGNVNNTTIKYSLDAENWSTEKPTFTNVGEYEIYVKFEVDNNHTEPGIYSGTVSITNASLSIPNNNITNYDGAYDGEAHSITVGNVEHATIQYSTDEENWSSSKPTFENVGTHTVYVRYVADQNYSNSETYSGTVNITKADLNIPSNSVQSYNGVYDGNEHFITVNQVSGASFRYSLDGTNWTTENPTRTDVGTTNVYVKYIGDSNHNDSESISSFIKITKADLNIPLNNITNYNGSYDGEAHSITVTPVEGSTINYSVDGTNWSTVNPTRTETGETVVYVKYVGDNNHNDSELFAGIISIGSSNLDIPLNNITNYEGIYDGEAHSISVAEVNGATIKYSVDSSTWSTDKPEYSDVGNYTIYVKYFGDDNHSNSSIYEGTVSIEKANLVVPENAITNYNGSYDEAEHSINVTSISGATIKYSTDGTTWIIDKPTYTDVGNYTVYVKYFGDNNHNNSAKLEGNVTITKTSLVIPENNITNYVGNYDGNEHSINVGNISNATIKYSTDGENWTLTKPTYTDVGEYITYVKYFGDNNHNDSDSYQGIVTINKASLSIPNNNITNYSGEYDGNSHSITVGNIDNATIKYSLDNSTWSTTKPSYTNVGSYTIYVKYFGDNNHSDSESYESTVSITKTNLTIPDNNITNYTGTFDGNNHSITVGNVDNATIKYAYNNGAWSTEKPQFNNVGNYTVYVKYFGDENHNDSTVYEGTIEINKADVTFNVTTVNSSVVEGSEEVFLKVNSNVAGTLSVSSSNNNIVTLTESNINIPANTDVNILVNAISHGNAQINLSFVSSDSNYNNYQTQKSITISEAEKIPVTIPTTANKCLTDLVYTGSSQTLTNGNVTGYTLSNNTGVNAGSYTVTASLQDGYVWSDSTFTDKTFNCSISRADLDVSSVVVEGYTGDYDGLNHSVTASNVAGATTKYSIDNENWSTEKPQISSVGVQKVYVKYFGDENHKDSNVYQTYITINQASPSISTNIISSVVYEGEEVTALTVSSDVAGTFNISSTDTSVFTVKNSSVNVAANQIVDVIVTGIKAGNKKVHIEFNPTNTNYKDMFVEETILVLEHEKTPVNIPTASTHCKSNLKYNGSSQVITREPAAGYTFTNNVQTNVGTYTVTAKLQDGYKWSDNSLTDKTFNCSIYREDSYLGGDSEISLWPDKTIRGIKPNTNYETLKSHINTNFEITHTKLDSDLASTCDTMTFTFDDDVQTFTLIVTGDVTKDAKVNEDDVNLLFKSLRNKVILSDCQIIAGDVVNNSKIQLNDVAKLYQHVKGKIERIDD